MAQAAGGRPNKFITLTSRYRPDEMTIHEAAQQLVHSWRMVIQRAKREGLFNDIQYIAVFELTKKGWPHLHILARANFLPQKWLSARMREYCDSPVVDVRAVKSQRRAAWYIAKYTAKTPEKFEGCKRYWRTLKYDFTARKKEKPVADSRVGFYLHDHVTGMASTFEKNGYTVAWDGPSNFIAYPNELDLYSYLRRSRQRKSKPRYKEH